MLTIFGPFLGVKKDLRGCVMQTTHTQCRLFSIRLASDEDESKVGDRVDW
jgi:hypothetical protein